MTDKTDNKIRYLIDKGSELVGGISSTALGLITVGPMGALGGAVMGPVVSEVLKKVGNDVADKFLSDRETVKIGATYALALDQISSRLQSGEQPRNDGFFSSTETRSSAEAILEGTLLKAKNEHEEQKLKHYSFLLSNLTFDESVSFSRANAILKIGDLLSYRQLAIIVWFQRNSRLEMENWGRAFNQVPAVDQFRDFYYELMDLYTKQILKQYDGMSMTIRNGELSQLGEQIYNLMNLEEIAEESLEEVSSAIIRIEQSKLK